MTVKVLKDPKPTTPRPPPPRSWGRIKIALLFTLALLQPIPAFGGDDWYRVGPGEPYGYGYSLPGSYTNSPDRNWPAINSVGKAGHDTRAIPNAVDRARPRPAGPSRSR